VDVFPYLIVFQIRKKYHFYVNRIQKNCLKLRNVAVVSKVGSKESEQAAKDIVKKLLAKKTTVYTISPIEVKGAKKIDTLEELKKLKLDLIITLGGDGTTLRVFRNLENEIPILTINVGGNRGILSEITIDEIDETINQILKDNVFLDKRTRVVASCGGKEFPPALIVRIGISFSRFLKTRRVVPSPPRVIIRSSFSFFNSSNVSIFFAPFTSIGEIV